MSKPCTRCGYSNADTARFCHQCGAMLEQEPAELGGDPLLGKVLEGRYRVVSVVGEGGMGKVYLAEQRMGTTTRKVAIKTLHAELSSDPQLVQRFNRECTTVVELTHPNTIKFYDFGELEETKSLFIVMEYIEGESLAESLQRGPLDPTRVDKLLIQIAGCLQEAHEKGVIHRDLKPENVLLTNRGGQTDFVKVLDFGIAKRSEAESDRDAKLTKQGMVLGTPPYMSPEQFSGQALDRRSDIYSVGIMTYEMLVGRLPFEAKTPWEWATKHLTQAPTPLESHPLGAQLPNNKKQAVMRCLAKDREARPATVMQFLQEFSGVSDPQAAWTLATSSGAQVFPTPQPQDGSGSGGYASGPMGTAPRGAAPTPGPMVSTHASGALGVPTPSGMSAYGSGAYGSGSYGDAYSSGEIQPPPSRFPGKVLLVVALLGFFILAGGVVGGAFWALTHSQSGATAQQGTGTGPDEDPNDRPIEGDPSSGNNDGPMIPTTPDQQDQDPTQVGEPERQDSDTPTTPTKVGSQPENGQQGSNTQEKTPRRGNPDRANASANEQNLSRGLAALSRNDLEAAASALRGAAAALGRRHPRVRQLRSQLATKGSNSIGIMLQRGDCGGARRLYRALARANAQGPSRVHFGDWCSI